MNDLLPSFQLNVAPGNAALPSAFNMVKVKLCCAPALKKLPHRMTPVNKYFIACFINK
jgi:hypothetical protein